jgi:hypothetical protein
VSRTNKPLLHSYWRPDRHQDREYVALSVDPAVINNRRCGFFRTNAALPPTRILKDYEIAGSQQFSEMFSRDPRHPLNRTASEEAEIMVFGDIPPYLIKGAFFESAKSLEKYRGLLVNLKAKVSRGYFHNSFGGQTGPRMFWTTKSPPPM